MANRLQIKRNIYGANGAPGTNSLLTGELAYDGYNHKLYIGRQTANVGNAADVDVTELEISTPLATSTVKGKASFPTANFVVNSGVVTIKTGGIARDELSADIIDHTKIADDAVTSDHIGDNQVLAAAIVDNVALAGNCSTVGSFTVGTDLIVQGTTVTLNTDNLTVEDKLITVGKNATNSDTSDEAGIEVGGWSGCPKITYDHTGTQWELNKNTAVTGTLSASGAATLSGGLTNTTLDFSTYS